MKKEREIALRILAHNIDNMSYWEDSKDYYAEGADVEKVNEEVFRIMNRIIKEFKLN